MPPKKAPAAASKKAEVKKKEKIIEVSKSNFVLINRRGYFNFFVKYF